MTKFLQEAFFSNAVFGVTDFEDGEEHLEFQFKFLVVVMLSAAVLTAMFTISSLTGVNKIDDRHVVSMCVFTAGTIVLWLLLRGQKHRFLLIGWLYETLCMAEYLSVTLFVPLDELRVFWYITNVAGVFILLGKGPGWIITVLSIIAVIASNSYVESPYSINALATFSLGLVYFALFFHVYGSRSFSYFMRMRQANENLAHMASHDMLTGVINARMYYETCNHLVSGAIRKESPFAVLFIDLDHFKSINDTLGHAAGDTVLKEVASCLSSNIRNSDVLGRIGGEEFSVFLPETNLESAVGVGEKLRQMVELLPISAAGKQVKVTASIGVASHKSGGCSMQEIQHNADQAMYEAKAKGRNRVSVFSA